MHGGSFNHVPRRGSSFNLLAKSFKINRDTQMINFDRTSSVNIFRTNILIFFFFFFRLLQKFTTIFEEIDFRRWKKRSKSNDKRSTFPASHRYKYVEQISNSPFPVAPSIPRVNHAENCALLTRPCCNRRGYGTRCSLFVFPLH